MARARLQHAERTDCFVNREAISQCHHAAQVATARAISGITPNDANLPRAVVLTDWRLSEQLSSSKPDASPQLAISFPIHFCAARVQQKLLLIFRAARCAKTR